MEQHVRAQRKVGGSVRLGRQHQRSEHRVEGPISTISGSRKPDVLWFAMHDALKGPPGIEAVL